MVPPVVLGHLLARLVDVYAAFAAGTGHFLQCSFHRQEVHRGTRIDRVLTDARMAAMVTDVAALPGTGIPRHLPVVFTMAMEWPTQRLVRAVRPQPVEVLKTESVLRMELEEPPPAPLQPDRDRLLASGAVVLLDVGSGGVPPVQPEEVDEVHPLQVAPMAPRRGRGTAALTREVRLEAGGGPKMSLLARKHTTQGAVPSLRQQAHPPPPPPGRPKGRG